MRRQLTAALVVVALILLVSSSLALAHERREVGKYVIEMGWRDEPALAGLLNAVFLEVHDKATDEPVEGLEKTLTVSVSYGGITRSLQPQLRRAGGDEKGVYVAEIIPTRAGDYTFRLQGKIEGQSVDERFESGPGRFDPITAATGIQYPDQSDLRDEVAALRDTASRTQLLAGVALLLGVIGLGLGVWAVRRAGAS